MAFQITDFGITAISTALVEKFRLKKSLQVGTQVLKSDGTFHTNEAYGGEFDFSVEGKGSVPVDFALGDSAVEIGGVTGGLTQIESTDERQMIGEEESWEASGVNLPDVV